MRLQLPIGYDDFGKIREKKLHFVDKSLFIQEVMDNKIVETIVITRPRRFGKTLNLSMLQHFFTAEVYGRKTQGLFDDLKIATKGDTYMQHQGKYPVIFISLKDVRDHSYVIVLENLRELIRRTYQEHSAVLIDAVLNEEEKALYHRILAKQINTSELQASLRNLTEYLCRYYGKKPWLLIDEYDTPIQSAFLHGYYDEMISLMRGLFSAALKTNPYLEKSVITGILRIAKESLFSGLNNVETYSLLQSDYGEYFGFTENEVQSLLQQSGLNQDSEKIRAWYNGYQSGSVIIYNPWSIANCIKHDGELRPYWVNTSGNELIKHLLARGDVSLKENLQHILAQQPIRVLIDESMVFADLDQDKDALYSLLLFSGYLKAISCQPDESDYECLLLAPNQEVLSLYRGMIKRWFSEKMGRSNYMRFLTALTSGRVQEFTQVLQDFLAESSSFFDVKGTHPEKFYHGFVLGLIVSLRETHQVRSNQESGDGRYDVMLIPKDHTQLGIVMEFKTVRDQKSDLTQAARQALQQIIDRQYASELKSQGITRILQLGLAFCGKDVQVVDDV